MTDKEIKQNATEGSEGAIPHTFTKEEIKRSKTASVLMRDTRPDRKSTTKAKARNKESLCLIQSELTFGTE